MVQDSRRGTGGSTSGKTGKSGKGGNTGGARQPAKNGARQSVAAVRAAKPGSNRTQVIIGICAVVVMAVIIVVGLVMNKKNTAPTVTDYGSSTNSVTTLTDNAVVASAAGAATTTPVTIDLFQDAMCPGCQAFEQQFGQQVLQSIDEGKLVVRYHMLTFLDQASASGNYSTRASAALLTVAQDTQAKKGAFLNYLVSLYADGTKPEENGSTDLSNQQLADLAGKAGASATAQADIKAGKNLALAAQVNQAGNKMLAAATGQVQTPTVLHDGKPLNLDRDWLTKLLAG